MRVLVIFLIILFCACSSESGAKNSNAKIPFDFALNDNIARFYLLEGDFGESLYLTITPSENIATLQGKIATKSEVLKFDGEAKSANLTLNFGEIIEAKIYENGELELQNPPKGVKSKVFRHAKTPEIAFINESMRENFTGADDGEVREFSFAIKQSGAIISGDSPQVANINATLASIMQRSAVSPTDGHGIMESSEDYGDSRTLSEKISTLRAKLAKANRRDFSALKNSGEPYFNYEEENRFSIDFVDSRIISMSNFSYIYSGGAHGSHSDDALIFSLKNGELLENTADALLENPNDSRLLRLILDMIRKNGYEVSENIFLNKFRIVPNGVEFYWDLYEIAPYAEGIIRATIAFADLAPFVRKDSSYFYLFQ